MSGRIGTDGCGDRNRGFAKGSIADAASPANNDDIIADPVR
jgi:hypothetical protein